MRDIHNDAKIIINETIKENLPYKSVENALDEYAIQGDVYLVAIGKAAWSMAKAASEYLGGQIKKGVVITKYEHAEENLPNIDIIEAGHPISDENTILGTQKAIELVKDLTEDDKLLFLISGGGSALFEKPIGDITLKEIVDINNQLLASGADIVEINMIRKRLSSVKAGRFAELAYPAQVYTVVLSDVLGDRLDSIASGPASPDKSTVADTNKVIDKYRLNLPEKIKVYLEMETPKEVANVKTIITGSVTTLCEAAAKSAAKLGYTPHILTSTMNCEAKEAGKLIGTMAKEVGTGEYAFKAPCAIILGGETVVRITGQGLGGRNQELALSAAEEIAGSNNVVVLSVGSDGTDGPTDAAGGIVDGTTKEKLQEKGIIIHEVLERNDSYNALKKVDGLILTGPTGTNVNDVSIILCK